MAAAEANAPAARVRPIVEDILDEEARSLALHTLAGLLLRDERAPAAPGFQDSRKREIAKDGHLIEQHYWQGFLDGLANIASKYCPSAMQDLPQRSMERIARRNTIEAGQAALRAPLEIETC